MYLTYLLTYLLTYSMVQSPSWEANWFAASQEIPRISRNPNVHYRTHKRPPLQASRMWVFLKKVFFYREGLLAPRPTPQVVGPPLVGYPRLLIQYVRSYPPYRRTFVYLQPEDDLYLYLTIPFSVVCTKLFSLCSCILFWTDYTSFPMYCIHY